VRVDFHCVFRALADEPECGDIGVIRGWDDHCFLGLVDALGHGHEAHEVARLAIDHIEAHFREDLVVMMRGLHERLKGSKGAVAALCLLNTATGQLLHVGVGNITVKMMGSNPCAFVPRDGVIGFQVPAPRLNTRTVFPGDVLVMHSDGIREHFSPLDHAGLLEGDARVIAGRMLEHFSKRDDDASCIVLRVLT